VEVVFYRQAAATAGNMVSEVAFQQRAFLQKIIFIGCRGNAG
jgi:hypothetical protein